MNSTGGQVVPFLLEKIMTRLEEILSALADDKCRYAILSAVIFAENSPNTFEIHSGTYGTHCLKRLLEEGGPED